VVVSATLRAEQYRLLVIALVCDHHDVLLCLQFLRSWPWTLLREELRRLDVHYSCDYLEVPIVRMLLFLCRGEVFPTGRLTRHQRMKDWVSASLRSRLWYWSFNLMSCESVWELGIERFLRLGWQNAWGLILSTILGPSPRTIFWTVKFKSLNDQFSSRRRNLLIIDRVLLLLNLDLRSILGPIRHVNVRCFC
jgi:hypothetical protein